MSTNNAFFDSKKVFLCVQPLAIKVRIAYLCNLGRITPKFIAGPVQLTGSNLQTAIFQSAVSLGTLDESPTINGRHFSWLPLLFSSIHRAYFGVFSTDGNCTQHLKSFLHV